MVSQPADQPTDRPIDRLDPIWLDRFVEWDRYIVCTMCVCVHCACVRAYVRVAGRRRTQTVDDEGLSKNTINTCRLRRRFNNRLRWSTAADSPGPASSVYGWDGRSRRGSGGGGEVGCFNITFFSFSFLNILPKYHRSDCRVARKRTRQCFFQKISNHSSNKPHWT